MYFNGESNSNSGVVKLKDSNGKHNLEAHDLHKIEFSN